MANPLNFDLEKTDITSPAFKADPHAFYRFLRNEQPVWHMRLPDKRDAYLLSRYDDASALLRDTRFVKNLWNVPHGPNEKPFKPPWVPGMFRPLERNMLDMDAPEHDRLKSLVHKAFTPKLVEGMRGHITAITSRLLDNIQAHGRADLIKDFALPLPVEVIAEVIGVPPNRRSQFQGWSKAVVSVTNNSDLLRALPSMYFFLRYLRQLITLRRAEPREDLLSALVRAEEAGDKLSEDELLAMLFLLLVAGHETSVNLIASGTLALLQHPDQLELLRHQPEAIYTAVEELLRFVAPVDLSTERFAREAVTLHGVTIPRGALAFAVIISANRDETHFTQADQLDLRREPNRHLAFGQGAHYCLGAPLARLEAQIAFPLLLERLPRLQLVTPVETLRWRKSLVLRGLASLPITY